MMHVRRLSQAIQRILDVERKEKAGQIHELQAQVDKLQEQLKAAGHSVTASAVEE